MASDVSPMSTHRQTIVVSGMVSADPGQGGATWAVLQYVLGFRQLGHDVLLVEPLRRANEAAHAPRLADTESARYFMSVVERFGLESRAALLCEATGQTVGLDYAAVEAITRRASVIFNVSGMLTDRRLLDPIPRRVYLDLDPAFVQLWSAVEGVDMRFAAHTHFVTVGLLLGTPHCSVPTAGRDWLPTLQPVLLDEWPPAETVPNASWTTIANWRGYGSVHHDGVHYGQKAHSFREHIDLPSRTRVQLRPALRIHPEETPDLAALGAHGWTWHDAAAVAASPDGYRAFIQQSRGELSVAKSGYVRSRCGWFSDRSACYLASGRPVIAQQTGFESVLPTGRGLIGFDTTQEAADALERVEADYATHSAAARELAVTHFDSRIVLSQLLERVGRASR